MQRTQADGLPVIATECGQAMQEQAEERLAASALDLSVMGELKSC